MTTPSEELKPTPEQWARIRQKRARRRQKRAEIVRNVNMEVDADNLEKGTKKVRDDIRDDILQRDIEKFLVVMQARWLKLNQ
jgi:hypothetical protein